MLFCEDVVQQTELNGWSHGDTLLQWFLWAEVAREPAGSKALPEWVVALLN